MRKFAGAVLLVIAAAYMLLQNYKIEGLESLVLTPRSQQGAPSTTPSGDLLATSGPPAAPPGETIRVASFNIQVFGESKLAKPDVMRVLAEIVRKFDVVAVQEIRAINQSVLPTFVDMINSTGRRYDYLIGPRLGRSSSKEQYAFIYDTNSIETDRSALYTVDDRHDLMHREPLVGSFRAKGAPPATAFTFTLINIHTDPDEVRRELDVLDDVYRAVRDDGRGEDDIVLLGDLNADESKFGQLAQVSGITWAISGVPTNTRGTELYDNLLFTRSATSEFTGRAGVLDMMREFNLSMDQALEVSDHFPVWAEFSVYEGGQPGRVAAGTETTPVR